MEKNNSIPEDVFNSKRYFKYIVEYQGDIKREISNRPGFYVIIINDKYAIVAVEGTGEFELQDPDIFSDRCICSSSSGVYLARSYTNRCCKNKFFAA